MLSLLSQPGASHDEFAFHAPSIWCARGIKPPACTDVRDLGSDKVLYASTNLDGEPCKSDRSGIHLCPNETAGSTLSNDGLYPGGFYFILSFFVIADPEMSLVLTRVVSALIVTSALLLLMILLPTKLQLALCLTIVTSLPATGYFLFSSINPSSWTALGVGVGWLALHGVTTASILTATNKIQLIALGLLIWGMAIVSRPDALLFVAFTCVLVLASRISTPLHHVMRNFSVATTITTLVLILALSVVSRWNTLEEVTSDLLSPNKGIDGDLNLTSYLIDVMPQMLIALGSIPTHSAMLVPSVVFVINFAVYICLFVQASNWTNRWQVVGLFAVLLAGTLAMASQRVLLLNEATGNESRYLFPLFVFGTCWWYTNAPESLSERAVSFLRPATVAITISFGLTAYAIAERFADRQSDRLRLIPEGPDNWWWDFVPVGPNVVVILSTVFIWLFLRGLTDLAHQET